MVSDNLNLFYLNCLLIKLITIEGGMKRKHWQVETFLRK